MGNIAFLVNCIVNMVMQKRRNINRIGGGGGAKGCV